MTRLGVGFLGAGIATQAIHIPTLVSLADRFRVTHVMDVNRAVATAVASVVDCPSTTDAARLLSDPNVQVVVVASPAEVHAEQVLAACRSGKLGILCEKPLATTREDARRIAEMAQSTGTPVVVGTMHAYDPACEAAVAAWKSLGDEMVLVRSRINLPSDEIYVEAATQVLSQPPPWTVQAQPWAPGLAEEFITDMMLGLTIHDIPLIRELLPTVDQVTFATTPPPIGYAIAAQCGAGLAQFSSLVTGQWDADWRLEASSSDAELSIEFPPSYVNAGSARARLTTNAGSREWRYPTNGYRAEWEHLGDVARSEAELIIPLKTAVDDLCFAFDLAAGAADILEGRRS